MGLRLKHMVFEADTILYFYEGEMPVRSGVVEFNDVEHEHWVRNAWMRGYRINADTGEQVLPGELPDLLAAACAKSATKEDADEGADAGRQPSDEDGVRSSAEPRSGRVSARRVGSGNRDGAAEGGTAD